MHSTDVLKRINALTGARDHLACPAPAHQLPIEVIGSDGRRTHIALSADAVREILTNDDAFAPGPIATAVQRIAEHTGMDMDPLLRVLAQNPMQTDGPLHASRRRTFIATYARALRGGAERFRACARSHFDRLIDQPPAALTRDVVAPAIDAMLASLLVADAVPSECFERIAGGSAVLEYMKHPRKLAAKAAEISDFLQHLRPTEDDDDDLRASVLVSYALQGRDPIVGGIAAFMHHWLSADLDMRTTRIEAINATELYALTAPVNYIVRIARRDIEICGHSFFEGEQILPMLPWANAEAVTQHERPMAFGAGAHACAGQALALALTDAFLDGLRETHNYIDWSAVQPERPVSGVFRHYGNP